MRKILWIKLIIRVSSFCNLPILMRILTLFLVTKYWFQSFPKHFHCTIISFTPKICLPSQSISCRISKFFLAKILNYKKVQNVDFSINFQSVCIVVFFKSLSKAHVLVELSWNTETTWNTEKITKFSQNENTRNPMKKKPFRILFLFSSKLEWGITIWKR